MAQIREIIARPTASIKQANGRIKATGKIANGRNLAVVYKQTSTRIIIVTTHHEN